MRVFFYGLFMDEDLLAARGIEPTAVQPGFVEGYELRIGERATLAQRPDSRAWGVAMEIDANDAERLYSEESVSDYRPEAVLVERDDGTRVEAICYNLPADRVTGTNRDYAEALLNLAIRLGFPDSYLDQIRRAR